MKKSKDPLAAALSDVMKNVEPLADQVKNFFGGFLGGDQEKREEEKKDKGKDKDKEE